MGEGGDRRSGEGPSEQHLARELRRQAWASDAHESRAVRLAVEAPLQLWLGEAPLLTLMRTPGSDLELLTGLLLTMGLVDAPPAPLRACLGVDGIAAYELMLDHAFVRERLAPRDMPSFSSCGVCGIPTLRPLEEDPLSDDLRVAPEVICGVVDSMRAHQTLYASTRAVHAAGLFDPHGQCLGVREDVGRHNAVDKVIGAARIEGRTLARDILVVSGRVSYEIVDKAVRARIPMIVAVSSPTTLAVDLAERTRITLCGRARSAPFDIYTHPVRVEFSA